MSIHLSGSVAYDRIMTFPGHFEDHLLPEKLHSLNVCFLIDHIEEKRGGTAGNIAYTLALLKEKPCIYTCVGRDFTGYDRALEALGISLAGIRRLEESLTACAYIITDKKGNQITGFSPAAMNTPCDPALYPKCAAGDWALVGPGNVEDMRALPALYRDTRTPYIFDPGQQVPALTPEALLEGFSGAALLIGNDYEIELIGTMTGLTRAQMLERVGCLITTLGGEGSEVARRDWDAPRRIAPISVPRVADPTGAGDSYRGGLLKALHAGLDMETAARMGTVCASFCVEQYGTQEHSFSRESFVKRYEAAFGPFPALSW
ncbi:MAG: carbohydrate kinase family protein [Desulfovibrionaceae bacterium]|nr:carbohydrate kinase family protein [Desulfovibrionaceae bacterium]